VPQKSPERATKEAGGRVLSKSTRQYTDARFYNKERKLCLHSSLQSQIP